MHPEIVVGSRIVIQNPTPALCRWARESLTLQNPAFYKLERMHKYTGNEPRTIELFSESYVGETRILTVPFGCLQEVWALYPHQNAYKLTFETPAALSYTPLWPLMDYQEPVPALLKAGKNGILVAPCGSGKTVTGLMTLAAIGTRALWLCHTVDLLQQAKRTAMEALGLSAKEVGTITDGKVQLGTHITFATVQTMAKLKNLADYRDAFGAVVVDECHRCAVNAKTVGMYERVLSTLCCRYKLGLTATAHRSDGLIRGMFALLGPVLYEIPKEAVEARTMPVTVCQIPTAYEPGDEVCDTDGTLLYARLVDDVALDTVRNEQIAADLLKNSGHSCLVLSDRIYHLRILAEMMPKEIPFTVVDGKTKRADRALALEAMRTGECRVLFATYALAKEGLDIPRLDRLFLAMGKRDYAVVVQSIGRIARKAPGKTDAIVYDYVDTSVGLLQKMARERRRIYKKQDYTIIDNTKIKIGGV